MLKKTSRAYALCLAVLAGPALVCATGCVGDDASQADSAVTEQTQSPVVIDESGDGQTFDVVAGQQVIVQLPGNPTTGYEWTVSSTDRTFGYPAESSYEPDGDRIGGGGVYQFIWETGGALPMNGAHSVELQYKRSWEQEAIDTFRFTVNILSPDEPSTAPVVLDESSDGTTVEVEQGRDVVVRLPGNASTGYQWMVASTDRTFGYPKSEDYYPDEQGAVGSGGVYELVWATSGALPMNGAHTVVLEYRRSWEQGDPADTFSFTVDIVAAAQQ